MGFGGMSNRELVEKAAITTDALATGGARTDQVNRFIDTVVEIAGLKGNSRVVKIKGAEWEVDKIGVGRRVAMPKTQANAGSRRRGIQTSKVNINSVGITLPFVISEEMFEDNIEGENIEDVVINAMAKQFANDAEELQLWGDTLGQAVIENDIYEGGSETDYIKDDYLALTNGWMKQARSGNIHDAENVNIGPSVFGAWYRKMPQRYKRSPRDLRWFIPGDMESLYRERMGTRQDGLGILHSDDPMKPFAVPMIPLPLMALNPTIVEHVTLPSAASGNSIALSFVPIVSGTEVVHLQTLSSTATAKYVKDTDYEIDYDGASFGSGSAAIRAKSGGALAAGVAVKVTYQCKPQGLLTHRDNLIVGFSRELKIRKGEDVLADARLYAMTTRMGMAFEEVNAAVFAKNIGDSL